MLADNALALAAQLRAVDSAFFECVDLAARGWLVQDGLVALNTTRDFLERRVARDKVQVAERNARTDAAAAVAEEDEDKEKKKKEQKALKVSTLRGSPSVEHLAAAILFLDEACVGRDDARFAAPRTGGRRNRAQDMILTSIDSFSGLTRRPVSGRLQWQGSEVQITRDLVYRPRG